MASTSSTPPNQWKTWDVFISFRGADTRYNILSHLSKALKDKQIKAFTDEELRKGEEISSELLKIIRESSISIVIFSENYADSSWCLDELVEILKCKEESGQIVLPVFYKVDPTEVQKLTGNFWKAFAIAMHGEKGTSQKVDNWKRALIEVSNLSGWDLQEIKSKIGHQNSIISIEKKHEEDNEGEPEDKQRNDLLNPEEEENQNDILNHERTKRKRKKKRKRRKIGHQNSIISIEKKNEEDNEGEPEDKQRNDLLNPEEDENQNDILNHERRKRKSKKKRKRSKIGHQNSIISIEKKHEEDNEGEPEDKQRNDLLNPEEDENQNDILNHERTKRKRKKKRKR